MQGLSSGGTAQYGFINAREAGSPKFISPITFWSVAAPLVTLQLLPAVMGTGIMTFASKCNPENKSHSTFSLNNI